jgi:hypothetical protein
MRLGIIIAALSCAGPIAAAQAEEPPLFAAFKSFCVATGAKPHLVRSAAEAAGATEEGPSALPIRLFEMTASNWRHDMGGAALSISAATLAMARGGADVCTLTLFANDDASVSSLRGWVGVAPLDSSSGNPTEYRYGFQEIDGERLPLPAEKEAFAEADRKGRIWLLVILRTEKSASAQLTHFLGAAPQCRETAPGRSSCT